jgi:hypothetical protein
MNITTPGNNATKYKQINNQEINARIDNMKYIIDSQEGKKKQMPYEESQKTMNLFNDNDAKKIFLCVDTF